MLDIYNFKNTVGMELVSSGDTNRSHQGTWLDKMEARSFINVVHVANVIYQIY